MSPYKRMEGVVQCDDSDCGRRYDSWVNEHCPECGNEGRK